jgi:hypothetical protein
MAQETAQVFAEVRDFPIYISHMDDHTRMPFAPWRVLDGMTALAGTAVTVLATYHWVDSGAAVAIFVIGAGVTICATMVARRAPIHRPTLWYRALWLANCVFGTQRRTSGKVSVDHG